MRLTAVKKAIQSFRDRAASRPIRSSLIPWLAGLAIIPALTVSIVTALSFYSAQSAADRQRLAESLTYASQQVSNRIDAGIEAAEAAAKDPRLATAIWGDRAETYPEICEEIASEHGFDAAALLDGAGKPLAAAGPSYKLHDTPVSPRLTGGRQVVWLADHRDEAYLAFPSDVEFESDDRVVTLVLFDHVGRELCLDLRRSPDVSIIVWPEDNLPAILPPGLPIGRSQLLELAENVADAGAFRREGDSYLAQTRQATTGGGQAGIYVTAVISDHGHSTVLYRATWLNILLVASVLLFAAGVGGMLARLIAHPIEHLRGAARTLARGDLSRRATPEGPKEFRDLVASFNEMAEAMETQTEQLRTSHSELDRQMDTTRQLNSALREAVRTDALTEVCTHGYIQERLSECVQWAGVASVPVSVLMVDVDGFKSVNDTYGHGTGDEVLKEVARCISGAVRGSDLVGRLGGDEFCVVLPGAGRDEAVRCMARIQNAVANAAISPGGQAPIDLSVSIGAATCPADGADPTELLASADRELYQVKRWRTISEKIGLDEGSGADLSDAQ
ncbi:MAG TPA: diguanylate cyclase, partial [Armatimonadota bacterium]|nr:diguanylate cyclase [Armatimonadota bacterium]